MNLSYKIGSLAAVSITAVFFGFYIEPEPRHELEAINSIGKPPQQQEIPLTTVTLDTIFKPDIVFPDNLVFLSYITTTSPLLLSIITSAEPASHSNSCHDNSTHPN